MSMPGGLSNIREADDAGREILTRALDEIQGQIDECKGQTVTLVSYGTQVVAGTNFFMKIQAGNTYHHVRVFRSLQNTVSVAAVKANQSADAELTHFQ